VIRVLVADDHPVVRRGLIQIVNAEDDLSVVAEAVDSQSVLDALDREPLDVVVLDITMPGRSGLDTLDEIRKNHSGIKVIVLSFHPEEQYAVRAIRAGASGYLNKDSAPDQLVTAIRQVAKGKKYLTPEVAEALAMAIDSTGHKALHEGLSNREFQVLRLIGSGKSVSEIARELSISVKTVSTYRSRILEKMNLKTNSELTRYVFEYGLIV
jgi:two-component system, NarL family, invasion response regulator UvrY